MSHVKEGYKQTKVGVIPDDWDVAQIKDVTDYVDYRGKTPKKVESGVLLVTARNIKQGYLDYDTSREYIAEDDYSNVMSRGMPKIGDVLLTTEAPLGNIAQIDNENIALAQRVIKFRAKDNFDNTYLKYHFLSERFQSYLYRLAIGTTVLGIQGKQLHKMLIPLPPLPEQQKIAKILTTWDSAISKQEELIKAKEELKKGLMQKLLSGEVRFGGEWGDVKLGEIVTCLDNKRVPLNKQERQKMQGDIPYYGSTSIIDYINDYLFDEELVLVSEDGGYFYDFKTKPIAFFITGKSWINNHVHIIKNKNDKLELKFLYYSLVHKNITAFLNGGTRAKLNKKDLLLLKLKLPPLQEQQKIAKVLTLADKEIELLKNELEELKQQKKGLMQKLLTGEVRVKI